MGTIAMPVRSQQQRLDALARGNEVRSWRAELKVRMKAREVSFATALSDPDWRMRTMHVLDLLLATPSVGRVKAGKVLKRTMVPPTRQVGMLTIDQRRRLISELGVR